MSIFKKSMMAALAMAVSATAANADEAFNTYIGLDLGGHQYEFFENDDEQFEAATIGGRIGVELNNNFGVEGRVGFGVSGDTTMGYDVLLNSNVEVNLDVNHYLAAFGKIQTNEMNGFRAYGLAGVAYVEVEASAPGYIPSTFDDTSFAWGLGASYAFNNNWRANLEYLSLNQDIDANSVNLGVTYHF